MSTAAPAGWHPDPRGRHEQRYWDGEAWTDHVADGGVTTIDPVDDRPRFRDVGGPRPGTAGRAPRTAAPETARVAGPAAAATEAAEPAGALWARPRPAAGPVAERPWAAPEAPELVAPAAAEDQAPPTASPPPPGRSRDVARVLSMVAPGAGHLFAGGHHRTAGFALLSAMVLAIVIAYLGFGSFLIGLGIYLTGAAYSYLDLDDLPARDVPSAFVGWACVIGGTVLAFSLLLPWYRIRVQTGGLALSASGFEALRLVDGLVLASGAVVAGAGLAILAREGTPVADLPPVLWRLAAAAGALALALIAFRMLVDPIPAVAPRGLEVSVGRAPGILLAAAAAVAVCATGVAAARAGYRRPS